MTGAGDPLWYKDAVFYEVSVRTFFDSDGDGVGDFRGLAQKLDYLQDLGVDALWLLPFYPSPLRDDGYDISDYTGVHQDLGTLSDFKLFLRLAHRRGLKVVTELVLNHTSDQHPWFRRAYKSPAGSRWRDMYVWSDTTERYKEARVIFKDFELSNWAWEPVAKAYYWHRFYSHQPDLNFDDPDVRRAVHQVLDFWLALGVDGMRLDAVPYLYEREGTSCENLPETHAFLKDLRRRVDERHRGRMFLAEANQWPEDAAAYFGEGDECHMAFHFPIMPRLFMAINMEDRFPLTDILQQTPPIPETCQWALFLRNHDELTLEMVTDEERDYMYHVYAEDAKARINLGIRRRLAPLLKNNRRKLELMNALLLSLPGTPILYYGDEIGMGDNIYLGDRNGVRTPMQWSPDRNAGFSAANPQRLCLPVITDPEYHYEAVNVETQRGNPSSLWWWMKRLIALRRRHKAFGRGGMEVLAPGNPKVFAFVRRWRDETILVAANLSRFVQQAELDLSGFKGRVPVELFGRARFPAVGETSYPLTFGPHGFFFFGLEPLRAETAPSPSSQEAPAVPAIPAVDRADRLFRGAARQAFEEALPAFLRRSRWFAGKALALKEALLADVVPLSHEPPHVFLTLVRVEYAQGLPETYVIPLVAAYGEAGERLRRERPESVVALLTSPQGALCDATADPQACGRLLAAFTTHRQLKGAQGGALRAEAGRRLRELRGGPGAPQARPIQGEQSNSSVLFGDSLILKLYRRPDEGVNPELEMGRFLTERARFAGVPATEGSLEYRRGREAPRTLAIIQGFVPNEGDAWTHALDALGSFFDQVQARPPASIPDLDDTEDAPPQARELVGPYLESARLLGRRTAELHLALASSSDDPAFAPEPMTPLYQRSLYQSMRSLTRRVFQALRAGLARVPVPLRGEAESVLRLEDELLAAFHGLLRLRLTGSRLRCHGDYHLGQVLYTGKDFVIIDFEGEPERPLGERLLKRSPLSDVAGMLRSFHYAASAALFRRLEAGSPSPAEAAALDAWALWWNHWVGRAFLRAYRETAARGAFLPRGRDEAETLLRLLLLEKAVHELGYELNNRPDWARVPIHGILGLLRRPAEAQP